MSPNSVAVQRHDGQPNMQIEAIQVNQQSSPQLSEVTMQSNTASSSSSTQIPTLFNGVPKTPEHHVFSNGVNDNYKDGYDSDGMHAPWLSNNTNNRTIVNDNEE